MAIPDIQRLTPEYRRLLELVQEQHHIDIPRLEKLNRGRTGARFYLTSISPAGSSQVRHLILTRDCVHPQDNTDEIDRHRQARDLSPPAFARQQIAQHVYELRNDRHIAVFDAITGQSLRQFRPLRHHTRQNQVEIIFRAKRNVLLDHLNTPQPFDPSPARNHRLVLGPVLASRFGGRSKSMPSPIASRRSR